MSWSRTTVSMLTAAIVALVALPVLTLIGCSSGAEIPDHLECRGQVGWVFGGEEDDAGNWIEQTADGGYIVTGYGAAPKIDTVYDVWLLKLDANGAQQWDSVLPWQGSDEGYAVLQTDDGGYVVAGRRGASKGTRLFDAWLVKTDSQGNMEWDKGWARGESCYTTALNGTKNGYVLVGHSRDEDTGKDDAWLMCIDLSGHILHEHTYGGPEPDSAWSAALADDGGYVIAGRTKSEGSGLDDVWLIKTDREGKLEWERAFGGPNADEAESVDCTRDGGYVITGETRSFGAGGGDVWLIKTDSSGNKEWDRTFGGPEWDTGSCVRQTVDGGFIIVGKTMSCGAGSVDAWLIKTDSRGNREWDRTFGGPDIDHGNCVQATADGGYVIVGYTQSFGAGKKDLWVIKTDADGIPQ